jgi:hypothetical protein
MNARQKWVGMAGLVAVIAWAGRAAAHCDTMDGPVVKDAQTALQAADVTSVLKWVQPQDEKSIRKAFAQTLEVRKQSEAARDLADRYFFETLVRVHRAGEGAPYTGLKPAGEVEPGIAAADEALEGGSADELVKTVAASVSQGIQQRYEHALHARHEAVVQPQDVDSGRRAVAAYVQYIHYVERIDKAAAAPAHAHEETAAPEP